MATPRILELQHAFAESVRISGEPRRRHTHKLPRDHPAQVALEDAMNQGSRERPHRKIHPAENGLQTAP